MTTYETETHGDGWVLLAGVMVFILDLLVIYGLVAYGGRRIGAAV